MEIADWENIRTGDIVKVWSENLGSDPSYRVQLVDGASPMWYAKDLFESYYRKMTKK